MIMKKKCGVVEDLLPLYVDGICSDESREVVEKHLMDCKKCEALLKDLKANNMVDVGEFKNEIGDADKILKDVSLSISRKTIYTAIGIVGIILYWLIYIWQDSLATFGDYRYFSYTFHEMYTIGYLLVPIFTIAWLISALWRMKKNRTWKKDLGLLLMLLILFTGQFGFWYDQSQKISFDSIVTVKEIVDEYHVKIECGEKVVLLTVEPMVSALLKTDGTKYFIGYESYKDKPYEGKLFAVWASDIE